MTLRFWRGGGQGFCDDSTLALFIKTVTMADGGRWPGDGKIA